MRTTFLKQQHEKCADILDLIEYAERRHENLKEQTFYNVFGTESKREEKSKQQIAVINRLKKYYLNQQKKIQKMVDML